MIVPLVLGGRIADLQLCFQEVKLITTTKGGDSFHDYITIDKISQYEDRDLRAIGLTLYIT